MQSVSSSHSTTVNRVGMHAVMDGIDNIRHRIRVFVVLCGGKLGSRAGRLHRNYKWQNAKKESSMNRHMFLFPLADQVTTLSRIEH